ncbi:gelsolin-related protein [Tieghemostelium lacteum]|uniref:Gelsolin-related protein n=1 Tax=Tieghemostelium lacteum TaxID=361077 RepID=A0A152A2P3_TIELA|nr:gelsolin-related protein [Tieghemostelium lacteum]|eukprot:KYR00496.1 gelsolin-related protein [Tieghemostelium lacteum]
MDPKREYKNKKNNVNSQQQHQQRKSARQQKKNKKQQQQASSQNNNNNNSNVNEKKSMKVSTSIESMNEIEPSRSPPLQTTPPTTVTSLSADTMSKSLSSTSIDNDNDSTLLSQNEMGELNKSVLDIKKQKDEYNHSHKKEKQKKMEERKKLINDSIHKKHELQKQIKAKHEEKKKLLEKQRIETQKELQKIKELSESTGSNSSGTSSSSGSISKNNSGTLKRMNSSSDEKFLDIFKRKVSQSNLSNSNGSLRKYTSYNSIGINSSSGLFRTISIPRLSKQQISLLDLFSTSSPNSSGASPSSSTSSLQSHLQMSPSSLQSSHQGLTSYGSFRSPKDLYDQFKKSSTGSSSGSSLRLSLKDDFYSKSNTHKRWEEYAKTLLPTEREQVVLKKEQERKRKLEELSGPINPLSNSSPMSPKRLSTLSGSGNRLSTMSTGSNGLLLDDTPSVPDKSVDDGKKIINALLNKTHSTPRSFACFDNEFSTASQKPPSMVNMFRYGSVDIDFSEVFGDPEDLKGFVMWSVHSFGVEERELDDYPILYSKDAYLVLNLSTENNQLDSKMYNIHIWIGKESPLDRIGTCVMMAIQLSTHLQGKVNHYREEQGKESKVFTNYFFNDQMNGIKYKSGGMDSDFQQIALNPIKRKAHLYKIDIPPIDIETAGVVSIRRMGLSKKLVQHGSSEISWLLECDDRIYYLLGSKASIANKSQTRKLAQEFQSHYARPIPIIDASLDLKEFYRFLKENKSKSDNDKDYKSTEEDETIVNLYKTCIKPNGKLGLEPIHEDYPMNYSLLTGENEEEEEEEEEEEREEEVYILDCTTDIFIYSSNTISKKKIAVARECAKIFYNEYERPKWAEISEVKKGNEPPLFKYQFIDWPKSKVSLNYNSNNNKNSTIIDSYYNFSNIKVLSDDILVENLLDNDESDQVDVYVVTLPDLEFFKLSEPEKSTFYEEDCYMTIISSRKERGYDIMEDLNEPKTIIYWWEGVHADPKGYSAFIYGLYPIIANKFQDKGQPKPLVRLITQRKEPLHFINSFSTPILIHKGSKFDEPHILNRIYQLIILDSTVYIQELIQDNLIMNSYDIYYIVSPLNDLITIWKGEDNDLPLSDDELINYATMLDDSYDSEIIQQGEESETFWALIPNIDKEYQESIDTNDNKLFRFYLDNKSSQLCLMRINRKYPSDLNYLECCLLETSEKLYMWQGINCSESLLQLAKSYTQDYYLSGENDDKIVQYESQYQESLEFKLLFSAWDRKDSFIDPLETRSNHLSIQKTLDYRKQCQEEQELFKEYLEYVNTVENEEDLEDFETWTLIKKGLIDTSILEQQSINNNSIKMKKKKKFLGLFTKKSH